MVTKQLTCNCASRYVRDAEHEGDCDLWLIDEFWAGFLAWDWDRECLVPTPKNPDYVRMAIKADEEDGYEWVEDYLAQKDERYPNGQSVEDVMLTTDAFIDRMLERRPEDEDATWQKNEAGVWVKVESLPNGGTKYSYGGTGNQPSYPGTTPSDGYDSVWGGLSDRHCQTPVHFGDGETTVYCTSLSKASQAETVPDFALYLDGAWRPDSMAIMLPWQDYGLPLVSDAFAEYAIKEAFSWAKAGAFVELGCIGAHGRTGAVLACMAVLADPELQPDEAVQFVRTAYCQHAIETREQEWFVARFHAEHHGLPVPEMPAPPPPVKPTVVTSGTGSVTPLTSGTTGSPSVGPAGDPNRKRGKARRSKRGGKRQQRHKNRMTQGSRR